MAIDVPDLLATHTATPSTAPGGPYTPTATAGALPAHAAPTTTAPAAPPRPAAPASPAAASPPPGRRVWPWAAAAATAATALVAGLLIALPDSGTEPTTPQTATEPIAPYMGAWESADVAADPLTRLVISQDDTGMTGSARSQTATGQCEMDLQLTPADGHLTAVATSIEASGRTGMEEVECRRGDSDAAEHELSLTPGAGPERDRLTITYSNGDRTELTRAPADDQVALPADGITRWQVPPTAQAPLGLGADGPYTLKLTDMPLTSQRSGHTAYELLADGNGEGGGCIYEAEAVMASSQRIVISPLTASPHAPDGLSCPYGVGPLVLTSADGWTTTLTAMRLNGTVAFTATRT